MISVRRACVFAFVVVLSSARPLLAQQTCPCPPPEPPPGNWVGSAGLGFSLNRGNTETTNLNVTFDAAYDPKKKDGTFVRHNIAQDFSTAGTNTGGVVFSESHGARFADMDGDKIPDMITGKRYWSEAGNNVLTHNDPSGDPVLYIYKTVRDPKAPGGARFVPELVHNKSGVGSSFDVVDLNKDGKPDIVVGTIFGTFTFTSKATASPAAPKK